MLTLAICKISQDIPYSKVLTLRSDNIYVRKKADEYASLLNEYLIKQDSNILITRLGYIVILFTGELEVFNSEYEHFNINYLNN